MRVLASIVFITGIGLFGSSPALTPRRVLVVGDSEAEAASLVDRFIAPPSDSIVHRWVRSTKVEYWAEGRFAQTLGEVGHVDDVVIFLGTNNYWNTQTPPVGPILDVIKQKHVGCVWVGPTSVQGREWPVNRLLHDAVTPTCTYFDTEAAHIELRDGVHPTNKGAFRWLRLVWPLVPKNE